MLLGLLGYANSFNVPFQFDDIINISQDPVIKNLDYYWAPSKAEGFTGAVQYPMLINRYVGSLSFALNYKMHGLDVRGYHVVNLLIHLINAVLVYWLVNLIFSALGIGKSAEEKLTLVGQGQIMALFVSLLFVSHPIQTQAVTYIVQRFTSLATMFYLLSVIMYARFRLTVGWEEHEGEENSRRPSCYLYYLLSLVTAVLAMRTKEIAFTIPVIIVLFELIFFEGDYRKRVLGLCPIVLTMLVIPYSLFFVASYAGKSWEITKLHTHMPRLDYFLTELRVLVTYIRLILFPVNQNLDYDYPISHSILDYRVLAALGVLMTIWLSAGYFFYRFKNTLPLSRVVFFGTAWFFVALSVESSFIPIVDVIFEHRVYLPSFGAFLVIAALGAIVLEKCRQDWLQITAWVLMAVISLGLTTATYVRNKVWRDKMSLWQDVVEKSPNKARGHIALGQVWRHRGDIDKALKNFRKAVELKPDSDSYAKIGLIYGEHDRWLEAEESFRVAVALDKNNDFTRANLALALTHLGRFEEAVREFKAALAINPNNAMTHNDLGIALGNWGKIDQAISELEEATRLEPNNEEFYCNLGMAFAKAGRTDDAVKELNKSLTINPDNIMARGLINEIKTGRFGTN